MSSPARVDAFTQFVMETEPRLRRALTATFGSEVGRDAAAEALAYGWKHWDRLRGMENPAGYLYRVGRDRGRSLPKPVGTPHLEIVVAKMPWVEPELPAALGELPEKQRTAFVLIHGYEWTFGEVAEVMGVSKATVQTHEARAMARLRERLGVTDDQ